MGWWNRVENHPVRGILMGSARYTVVFEWDEIDGLFIAAVPALTISTYGGTRLEALENAKEAIAVTLEGMEAKGQAIPREDEKIIEVVELEV